MKLPRSFATRKKEEKREKKRERKRHLYGGISRFHCELKPIADRNADRDRRLVKWFMRLLEGIFPSRSVHVADARRKSFIARGDTASDLRNFYSRKSNIHPPRALPRFAVAALPRAATCRLTRFSLIGIRVRIVFVIQDYRRDSS